MSKFSTRMLPGIWLCLVACSGGGDAIQFDAELPLLPSFEKDTGLLPADQPVQVRVVARADGAVKVHAEGTADDGELVPVAGSGALDVSASFAFEIYARIDFSGVSFDGLVEALEYAVPASTATFDPFLLDGEAVVTTPLPAQELATLPLGSVPGGTLVLSIVGGTLDTSFSGTCATADGEMTQYKGTATTTGTVELGATIRFEIPIVGTQEFGPITIPVDVPAIGVDMDLGTREGGSVVQGPGPCDPDYEGGDDDGGSDDGGSDDGGSDDGGSDDGGSDDDGGDGGGANCGLPDDLGDLGLDTESEGFGGQNFFQVGYFLDTPEPVDVLVVMFLGGKGVFRDGFAPGVHQIAGDDTDTNLCGNCVFLVVDAGPDGTGERNLMAESGTVTVAEIDTTVGTGRVSATLTDVSLREITLEDGVQQEVEGGCKTRVGSYTFDVVPES